SVSFTYRACWGKHSFCEVTSLKLQRLVKVGQMLQIIKSHINSLKAAHTHTHTD
ncbi:hypothetical protein BgiMline_029744, partial [Biomphalaria glabrata]